MMDRPDPDFRAIIAGLEASGLRRTDIARQLHVSRSCITRIGSGQRPTPSWSVGAGLVSLAERHIGGAWLRQNAQPDLPTGNKT